MSIVSLKTQKNHMANYILFDGKEREALLPLSYTRPVGEIRIGIQRIREKWESYTGQSCSYQTQEYLSQKYTKTTAELNLFVNGSACPNDDLLKAVQALQEGQCLLAGETILAACISADRFDWTNIAALEKIAFDGEWLHVANLWDIFSKNGEAIQADFDKITAGRTSRACSDTNTIIGDPSLLFIEEGASVEGACINLKNGPVYLGAASEIMEGSLVRGPLALCEHATLKLGAKIYGPTTVGPHSKIGGEVNNSVIIGYSNKGHDGFLGNSVLGEWCNIGADSNNSNLKNNYAEVRLWDYQTGRFAKTGLQFCGLVMGDHSKCGINTMFNTGTVVGVSANIFGSGFPRNFVASFSWGGASGFTTYQTSKAFEVAGKVMERRNLEFDEIEKNILEKVFELSEQYRR